MRSRPMTYLTLIALAMATALLASCGMFEAGIETPSLELETEELPTQAPSTEEPLATYTVEPDSTEIIVTQEMSEDYVYALYGRVASLPLASQFDDLVSILPEGTALIGIEGAIEQLEQQIIDLRDKPAPGNYAHFWGTLICPAVDYGGCQLRVESMRIDEPGRIFEPAEVDGWIGTIHTGRSEPGSGGDDYFQLEGDFAIQYGIAASSDPSGELASQIEDLRDTGTRVRVWGWLVAGIPDWNATQLQVTRLEILP